MQIHTVEACAGLHHAAKCHRGAWLRACTGDQHHHSPVALGCLHLHGAWGKGLITG